MCCFRPTDPHVKDLLEMVMNTDIKHFTQENKVGAVNITCSSVLITLTVVTSELCCFWLSLT